MKKLYLTIVFAALVFAVNANNANAASEAEGQDLFQRGHYAQAIELWEEAALAGDIGSAYKLGATYIDGVVVKRDLHKSLKYMRQAAEGNDPRGLTELAGFYDYGTIVKTDKNRAAKLYLKAAKQGFAAAMFNVASFLENGEGLAQDKIEAYKYYLLSRDQGFAPFAVKALQDLENELSKEQLAEGKTRADNFFATFE